MNIAILFGKLREHELKLGRLKEEEDGEKRHTIALKNVVKTAAKLKKIEFADDSNDGNSDREALSLMVKKFSKFLKCKNKTNNNSGGNKSHSRKQERSSTPTSYECGKMGHIKSDCPVLKLKQKLEEKSEANKHKKKKKVYNSDSSSSSESDGSIEEKTNLYLMARTRSSQSSVSSFKSNHDENSYCELLDTFNELHEEATKLQQSTNRRKGEIKWLEGRVKQLEDENENLTVSLGKLEKAEKDYRSKYGTSSLKCENCPRQLEKIDYLMKTLSKFTLGRSNLDVVLGYQRSVLNREGIGYSGKSNRLGTRNFLNISKPSSITCTYYFELGHASNSCYFKNYGVPKEKYKWVLKGTPQATNMKILNDLIYPTWQILKRIIQ